MRPAVSYTDHFGYYNLRVNQTLEQVLKDPQRKLLPLPDRKATWYANSLYRSLILDAEQGFQDQEAANIRYRQSGAHLPEAVARVRESAAGDDEVFDEYDRHHERVQHQDAMETAMDLDRQHRQQATAETRRHQLYHGYGANKGHPVIEATHDELEAAGAPHFMPMPRFTPSTAGWEAPHQEMMAKGQPQAPEFPDFAAMNMGGDFTARAAVINPSQNLTYERARDLVVQPTWSS